MLNKILTIIVILLLGSCSPAFLGDYNGKVIDSQTGQPLKGVIVRCEWNAESPTVAGGVSSKIAEYETTTDLEGKFTIPIRTVFPRPISTFSLTDLFIQAEGYETANLRFMEDSGSTRKYKKNMLIRMNKLHLYGPDFVYTLRDLNYTYIRADKKYFYFRPEQFLPDDPRTIPIPSAVIQNILTTSSFEDLINFSKNSNVYVRQAAIRQCGKLYKTTIQGQSVNTAQSILKLVTSSLEDSDDYVVETAIWVLGQLDSPEGTKAIAPMLVDDRYRISTMAFEVAKKSKWNSSREHLIATLRTAATKYGYADERGTIYKLRADELQKKKE